MKMPKAKTKKTAKKRKYTLDYDDGDEDTEYVYDEITGGRMKKPVMSVLNKTKLSKYEMDDLFNTL
jgi:hypothetical protein